MNQFGVCDVLRVFIFSSSLPFSCVARAVIMAKLLEEGYLRDHEDPAGKTIEFPENYNGTEVTVCFWLHPYRYVLSNSVLSFSQSSGMNIVSIYFNKGSLMAKLHDCSVSLDEKPKIREWNHYCISLSEDVKIFVRGVLSHSYDCGLKKTLNINQESVIFSFGWDTEITNPFSGLVADAKFFWRELSHDEIKNISLVDYDPSGFDSLLNLTTYNNSHVEITEVPVEELLEEYMPYILHYISERNNYERAAKICKARQGLLPDFKKHGKKTLTKLIAKFSSVTGVSFDSFWVNSLNDSTCFIGTFIKRLFNIEESTERCNNPRISYFCIVEKHVQYRLIGFNEDDIIFHSVPYKIGVFETEDIYRLYLKNGHFILKDLSSSNVHFISESRDSDELLGRYNWYEPDSNHTIKMAFSGCKFNESTCSDGMCIDFEYLCQFHAECDDDSDEIVNLCEVGFSPGPFYDKRLPPSSVSNATTNISIEFELLRFLSINKDSNTFQILVNCILKWRDPRLEFKFLKPNYKISVSREIADEYWRPDLEIKEALHDDKQKLSLKENPGEVKAMTLEKGILKVINSYRARYYGGKHVLLIGESSVPVTIACEMDLFFYPFDDQTCSFSIELVNEILTDFRWETSSSSISMGPGVYHAFYEIYDFKYNFTNHKELQISVKFARKYGSFILTLFLPSFIFQIITILTHLFPLDDYDDRGSTSLTVLMTISALFTEISISLSGSGELKLLDIWMFFHVIILIENFFLQLMVIIRAKSENRKKVMDRNITNNSKSKVSQREEDSTGILSTVKFRWKKSKLYEKFFSVEFNGKRIAKYALYLDTLGYGVFLFFFFLVLFLK